MILLIGQGGGSVAFFGPGSPAVSLVELERSSDISIKIGNDCLGLYNAESASLIIDDFVEFCKSHMTTDGIYEFPKSFFFGIE